MYHDLNITYKFNWHCVTFKVTSNPYLQNVANDTAITELTDDNTS